MGKIIHIYRTIHNEYLKGLAKKEHVLWVRAQLTVPFALLRALVLKAQQ